MRPNWDEYFLLLSFSVASRATCNQAKHGCVISYNNQVISTGYNGSPSKELHCIDVGCNMIGNHCLRCRHAEMNAIIQGLKVRNNLKNCKIYVTGTPCLECANHIIREKISQVTFGRKYGQSPDSISLLESAGILVNYINIDDLIKKNCDFSEIGIKKGG